MGQFRRNVGVHPFEVLHNCSHQLQVSSSRVILPTNLGRQGTMLEFERMNARSQGRRLVASPFENKFLGTRDCERRSVASRGDSPRPMDEPPPKHTVIALHSVRACCSALRALLFVRNAIHGQ